MLFNVKSILFLCLFLNSSLFLQADNCNTDDDRNILYDYMHNPEENLNLLNSTHTPLSETQKKLFQEIRKESKAVNALPSEMQNAIITECRICLKNNKHEENYERSNLTILLYCIRENKESVMRKEEAELNRIHDEINYEIERFKRKNPDIELNCLTKFEKSTLEDILTSYNNDIENFKNQKLSEIKRTHAHTCINMHIFGARQLGKEISVAAIIKCLQGLL